MVRCFILAIGGIDDEVKTDRALLAMAHETAEHYSLASYFLESKAILTFLLDLGLCEFHAFATLVVYVISAQACSWLLEALDAHLGRKTHQSSSKLL